MSEEHAEEVYQEDVSRSVGVLLLAYATVAALSWHLTGLSFSVGLAAILLPVVLGVGFLTTDAQVVQCRNPRLTKWLGGDDDR